MKSFMLASIATLLVSAAPDAGSSAIGPQQRIVSYSDLDLSNEADLRKLDRRISSAAREVCGTTSDADPAGKNEVRRCRATVREGVRAQRDAVIASVWQRSPDALAVRR